MTSLPSSRYRWGQEVDEKHELKLDFALPVTDEQKRPSVKGYSGSVIKATMLRLPVLRLLAAMTARNTEIRLPYSSPVFTSGSFLLESDGTDRSASLKEISLFEQGFLGVTGVLYSNGSAVTGELVFESPPTWWIADACRPALRRRGMNHSPRENFRYAGIPAGQLRRHAPGSGAARRTVLGTGTAPSRGTALPAPCKYPCPPALR